MKIIITSGPTREHIDSVRFITNASSGRMGCACADAAVAAGHKVTLITGPVAIDPPAGCEVVRFTTVEELKAALDARFNNCDVLIMAAAVGDFTVGRLGRSGAEAQLQSQKKVGLRSAPSQPTTDGKISRSAGPIQITLTPTEDILAGLGRRKGKQQTIVGFAVEAEADEAKARRKMESKNCDYLVANTPAAMSAESSEACIFSPDGIALPWASRTKTELAKQIITLLETK